MTESIETQLENTKNYLEKEERRRLNLIENHEIKLRNVDENILNIKKKVRLLGERIKNFKNKQKGKEKSNFFCVGCGKKIKQGKYCDSCRIAVEKIRYQTSKEMWEKLPEEEKIKRMEKLSKSLLNEDETPKQKIGKR